jgi:hypothetical protein
MNRTGLTNRTAQERNTRRQNSRHRTFGGPLSLRFEQLEPRNLLTEPTIVPAWPLGAETVIAGRSWMTKAMWAAKPQGGQMHGDRLAGTKRNAPENQTGAGTDRPDWCQPHFRCNQTGAVHESARRGPPRGENHSRAAGYVAPGGFRHFLPTGPPLDAARRSYSQELTRFAGHASNSVSPNDSTRENRELRPLVFLELAANRFKLQLLLRGYSAPRRPGTQRV